MLLVVKLVIVCAVGGGGEGSSEISVMLGEGVGGFETFNGIAPWA